MKISTMIELMTEYKETYGDLEVVVSGHPGELGTVVESEYFYPPNTSFNRDKMLIIF